MRIVGILAIFLLSVGAIAEGAALFRLSRQVRELSQQVAVAHEHDESVHAADPGDRPAARVAAAPLRPAAVPRPAASPPAFTPSAPSVAATATLRDALSTPEGREQLRSALDIIAEQRRQERLVKYVERREERDQRWKEQITKNVPLSGEEPAKVSAIFASLQTARRQLLEDMRAGSKTSEETDSALDDLQENTQKALHGLLGDDRWRKLREGRERGGGNRQNGPRPQGQAPAAGTSPAAGAPPPAPPT
jgi:hypothetical protein